MGSDQSSSQQGSSNSESNCPICGGHRNVRHGVSLDTDGYSRASSGGYIGSVTNLVFYHCAVLRNVVPDVNVAVTQEETVEIISVSHTK
ncbi:unnamed protein product [Rotaria socialis]|uniref:Uncharacterized protein n=1 Tax=Rotaria socialis TaxID=392032 RepID=A0A818Q027_9BILA|nr:unnamed protein product [Rotaria socialis]CAF3648068.1 unnamed protein product [Rotaria socialis]